MNEETFLNGPLFSNPLILGAGQTGQSIARFLHARKVAFVWADSRKEWSIKDPSLEEIPIKLGPFDERDLCDASLWLVSPGVPITPAMQAMAQTHSIPIWSDIELFVRCTHARIVAITGSNGKSTVTTLVGEMLKQAGARVVVGGNIGIPILSYLSASQTPFDWVVLELSSFQLEHIESLKAQVATVLNVTPDHLDRYPSFEAYQRTKWRIYDQCQWAILNWDDPGSFPDTKECGQQHVGIGSCVPSKNANEFGLIHHQGRDYLAQGTHRILECGQLKIQGRHNWLNALIVLAIAKALEIPQEVAISTLKHFKGLAHRCEWVTQHNHTLWFNDSKGTNPGATQAALKGLGENKANLLWIAGGQSKGADFSPLKPLVAQHVREAIFFGEAHAQLLDTFKEDVSCHVTQDLMAAVVLAQKKAHPFDRILFSPACASFDQFDHFAHRGECFKQWVKKVLGKHDDQTESR